MQSTYKVANYADDRRRRPHLSIPSFERLADNHSLVVYFPTATPDSSTMMRRELRAIGCMQAEQTLRVLPSLRFQGL